MEMETNLDALDEESLSPRRPCCCCCFPFSRPWDRLDAPAPGERRAGGGARAVMMKAREWSELAAGPRWKNFLRRFGRNPNRGRPARFQYDPLSYTLNFDEGPGGENPEGGNAGGHRDFTARFATAAPLAKLTEEPLTAAAAAAAGGR